LTPPWPAVAEESATAIARRLAARRRGRALAGRLRADDEACAGGARVVLERRVRGRWRLVAGTRTRAGGWFRVSLPARGGAYRLRVPASAACASAYSRAFITR
jgi:hypothetical protein